MNFWKIWDTIGNYELELELEEEKSGAYYEEGSNLEFKETWRDEYLKTLAAFANSSGGKCYWGG